MIGFWSDRQKAEQELLKIERCPAHPRYRAERKPTADCLVCKWLFAKAEEMRKGPTFGGVRQKDFLEKLNGGGF